MKPDEKPSEEPPEPSFKEELTALINRHSLESSSGTPDFILAEYLRRCLEAYNLTVQSRERFFGKPGPDTRNPHEETWPSGSSK